MKYNSPKNASFLLPRQYTPALLQADLETCREYDFLKNYIPENYDGEDYILPLRSIEGRLNMIAALPDNTENYEDTIALDQCPYFKEVIASFLCKKEMFQRNEKL